MPGTRDKDQMQQESPHPVSTGDTSNTPTDCLKTQTLPNPTYTVLSPIHTTRDKSSLQIGHREGWTTVSNNGMEQGIW